MFECRAFVINIACKNHPSHVTKPTKNKNNHKIALAEE
jgi:hypothetical protein